MTLSTEKSNLVFFFLRVIDNINKYMMRPLEWKNVTWKLKKLSETDILKWITNMGKDNSGVLSLVLGAG